MQIDDRLATVLAMPAESERAVRTQFRQLVDLAGSAQVAPPGTPYDVQLEDAYARIGSISARIPAGERAAIVRQQGSRLRNPGFVAYLASQELPVASAAVATARLGDAEWQALIPALPPVLRTQVGQRRDLPPTTRALLDRLGLRDAGLPEPDGAEPAQPASAAVVEQPEQPFPTPASESGADIFDLDPALELAGEGSKAEIGALLRRIDAFRKARENAAASSRPPIELPSLPLGLPPDEAKPTPSEMDFVTDAECRIVWATQPYGPMTVGLALASRTGDAAARADTVSIAAMRRNQPVSNGTLEITGAPAVSGEWRIDAAPWFTTPGGRFAGYRGRLRRPAVSGEPEQRGADSSADRMRQVIHELRTPVNAIQGFAEIIQQQLFGPTPNEYRALAASIAGDAARMLAGFEELDRLVKLESGVLRLEDGVSDLRQVVDATARQLGAVLRQRSATLEFIAVENACPVPLSQGEAELLIWRLLATLAGTSGPGEAMHIVLARNGARAAIEVDLPASLAGQSDVFQSSAPASAQAVTAGMFGTGFTLRLARAEARAAGGDLQRIDDLVVLTLPLAGDKSGGDMDLGGEMSDTA